MDAGRLGNSGCRVYESILVTWMSQNLSLGSDSLDSAPYKHALDQP